MFLDDSFLFSDNRFPPVFHNCFFLIVLPCFLIVLTMFSNSFTTFSNSFAMFSDSFTMFSDNNMLLKISPWFSDNYWLSRILVF